MQGKNIKVHLKNKIRDWIESIADEQVKEAILENAIVTGGAIVSLLQGEDPHDYDIYFKTEESLKRVADYYVKQYVSASSMENAYSPRLQRCFWNDEHSKWTVLAPEQQHEDVRLRILIKSEGAVGEGFNPHSETDADYKRAMALMNAKIKKTNADTKAKDKNPYRVKFMTNNAISLSDKIQIILRFYGEPNVIHKNYDFVHCTSYWTSWNNELVLPARALEAIINKELYYVGSRYPLCSIIRTRKFINRGWNINAGQYVKMVLQLNDLNLKNLHIFEEQLIGVDSAYFGQLISIIEKMKKNDPNFTMDSGYLINLINNVFDDDFSPKEIEE